MGMLGGLIAHKDDLLGCLFDYNAINGALQQLPSLLAFRLTTHNLTEHGLSFRYRCDETVRLWLLVTSKQVYAQVVIKMSVKGNKKSVSLAVI